MTGKHTAPSEGLKLGVSWLPLPCRLSLVPSKYSMTVMVFVMMLSFYYFSRHVSARTPSFPVHILSGPPEKQAQDLRTQAAKERWFPLPSMARDPVKPLPSPFSGLFLSDTSKTALSLFLLTSSMLKEAWGGVSKPGQNLFPRPEAYGSSFTLAPEVTNILLTEPEEKGKEAEEAFVWLKCKKERGRGRGSLCMQGSYCSMLAQVPPSGWPGEVQPSQALLGQRGSVGWTWGPLPGLGDPHCCHLQQVRHVATIDPRSPHTSRRPLSSVLSPHRLGSSLQP